MSKFTIQRYQTSIPLVHGGAVTTVQQTGVPLNGILMSFKLKTGAVDGTTTATLNIIDADGDTVYTKASIPTATTNTTLLTNDTRVPLSGVYTVQVVFSNAQTATDNTVIPTLIIDRG